MIVVSHMNVTVGSGLESLWNEEVVVSFESYEIISQGHRCPSRVSKLNVQNTSHKCYCLSQLAWQDEKIQEYNK